MNKKDKKDVENNKFNFVTMYELENVVKEFNENKNIETGDNPDKVNALKFKYDDDKIENNNTNKNTSDVVDYDKEAKIKFKNKIHFSFETRVIFMVILILVLFGAACTMVLEAINFGSKKIVTYTETSSVNYLVCLNKSDINDTEKCLSNLGRYDGNLIDKVKANFKYNVDISEPIKYNLTYHIDIITKVYDGNNYDRVLYKNEESLIQKTRLNDLSSKILIDSDVVFDYQKYNQMVINYKNSYSNSIKADLKVVLYLDEKNETRELSSIIIPLGEDNVVIKNNIINNENKEVFVNDDSWNEYNTICAVLASILIITSLVILFKTTKLVLRVTVNRNKYQLRLSQILRDYDRIIVVARDGYVSNRNHEVVKVDTFDDLLDIKENLSKPIVFSRINDIKSEFIVEDNEKLYKFTLKDTDF